MIRAIAAASFAAMPFFFAEVAVSQNYQDYQNQAPGGEAQAQPEVSDSMLEQYSEASSGVQAVQEEFSSKIQSTQDAEKAQSLRNEAQKKMVDAVEGSGLTVNEYNLITQQVQTDQNLAKRLNAIHGR